MTKTREQNVTTPATLPTLLPETRSPRTVEKSKPIATPPTSNHQSPRTTLFRRSGPTYATTSFSAVFQENQAQIGVDLLDVKDDGLNTREEVYNDPVRMKLAIKTLQGFPTYETCERLLLSTRVLHDVWLSPTMIQHCLQSVWSTFGSSLKGPMSDRKLSNMAYELFKNGKSAAHPDDDQPWVNWFGGLSLRWEMIGILFSFFGLSMMCLQDWDPIFNVREERENTRKSAAHRMKQCADACLKLRNTDHPTNDIIVILFKNIGKLYSQIEGDECEHILILSNRYDLYM